MQEAGKGRTDSLMLTEVHTLVSYSMLLVPYISPWCISSNKDSTAYIDVLNVKVSKNKETSAYNEL